MDSFELNKILGAVLGTCLGVLALNIVAGAIFVFVTVVLLMGGGISRALFFAGDVVVWTSTAS